MDTQYAIIIAVAAGAFAVALLAVLAQWLKADDAAFDTEAEVRETMKRFREQAHGATTDVATSTTEELKPEDPSYQIGDDETAFSRLLLAWGAVGTFTGLAIGAATWGPVGALLGGVVLGTMSNIGVVVGVLIVDRVHRAAAERRLRAARAPAPTTLVEAVQH